MRRRMVVLSALVSISTLIDAAPVWASQVSRDAIADSARTAASRVPVANYFLLGLLTGAPMPFVAADRTAITIGVSLLGASAGIAAGASAPRIDSSRLASSVGYARGSTEWTSYLNSYRSTLAARRRRALMLGILTGGVAAFFLFLPVLPDT